MRTKGSKNKQPSRRDLTKVSIETLVMSYNVLKNLIDTNRLTEEQKIKISLLFEQMDTVLKSGSKHLDKGYL